MQVTVYEISTDTVRRLDLAGLRATMPLRVQKADRFRYEKDRLLCLGAGYLLMEALGVRNEAEIRYGEYGKPYIPGRSGFSISHSGSLCILAEGDSPLLGADLEKIDARHTAAAVRVCTPEELEWMRSDPTERFFRLWTWKESLMKATGCGMRLAPGTLDVLPFATEKCVRLQNREWYASGGLRDGYAFSVCADAPIERLRWINVGE